jgi:hypothetical protein
MNRTLSVGADGSAQWIAYEDVEVVIVPADFEAWLDEQFGKPQLGIEDSCGLMDYDAEVQDLIDARMDEQFWTRGEW